MARNIIRETFLKAGESSSRFQKCQHTLERKYSEAAEEFTEEFLSLLHALFIQSETVNKAELDRCFTFAAQFCVYLALDSNKNSTRSTSSSDEEPTHPFLRAVIYHTLKYHDVDYVHVKSRACHFITLLLQQIGDEGVDQDICDDIQNAMLERIEDTKKQIRLQAITALVRLQNPGDLKCPVVNAFLECLYDTQAMVRKSVVEQLALNHATIPKILERLYDMDHPVRLATFKKCLTLDPQNVVIEKRHAVILAGITERHAGVKKVFYESLVPKWLEFYDDKIQNFFKALKLDLSEDDIEQTLFIYRNLFEHFCKNMPLRDVIDNFTFDDSKLIPIDKLSFEVAASWNILCDSLQATEKSENYLELVQPELHKFCDYIESVITEKLKKSQDKFDKLVCQYILLQLFQIAERYDLGDLVGLNRLRKLALDVLLNQKLHAKVVGVIIDILYKCFKDTVKLADEICQLISEIREPLVDVPPNATKEQDRNFEIATLNVKLNILKNELEQAEDESENLKAIELSSKITELQKQIKAVLEENLCSKVRQIQDDPEIVCRCLDILICFLQLPWLTTMCPSLLSCKDEFIKPLMGNMNPEIFWRVSKVILLYGILDKQVLQDNKRRLFDTLVSFRLPQQQNVNAILVSIEAITDMVNLYGPDVFREDESGNTTVNTSIRRRKLYSAEKSDDQDLFQFAIDFQMLTDILLDLLDVDFPKVKHAAAVAIVKLLLGGTLVTSTLISRLIVKWICLQAAEQKLQQLLGMALLEYAQTCKNNEEIIVQAIMSILMEISNANGSSPLLDLDVDKTLQFFAAILTINSREPDKNVHQILAVALCKEMSKDSNAVHVPLFVKMLLQLDFADADDDKMGEIVELAENLLQSMLDKISKRNMEKIIKRMRYSTQNETIQSSNTQTSLATTAATNMSVTQIDKFRTPRREGNSSVNQTMNGGSVSKSTKRMKLREMETTAGTTETDMNATQNDKFQTPVQERNASVNQAMSQGSLSNSAKSTKRKKLRGRTTDVDETVDETILHTILEKSVEKSLMEGEEISLCTPPSQNSTIISATSSDSESTNSPDGGKRQSKRRS